MNDDWPYGNHIPPREQCIEELVRAGIPVREVLSRIMDNQRKRHIVYSTMEEAMTAEQVAALYNKYPAIAQRVCDDAGWGKFGCAIAGADSGEVDIDVWDDSYCTVPVAHALTLFCAAAQDLHPGWTLSSKNNIWWVKLNDLQNTREHGQTRNAAILAALEASDGKA